MSPELAIGASVVLAFGLGVLVGVLLGLRHEVDEQVGRVLERELRLPRVSDSKRADDAEGQGE